MICALVAGRDGVVEGVGGGDLVGLRGFDYGLPSERVERVRVGGDAQDGGAVVVGGLCEVDGLLMLDKANGPKRGHGEKSGDGPAPAAEGWFACANFAADEAEEGWRDESDEEDEKE